MIHIASQHYKLPFIKNLRMNHIFFLKSVKKRLHKMCLKFTTYAMF